VANAKPRHQAKKGKLLKPEYMAMFWNQEIFKYKESPRKDVVDSTGTATPYSIQECELEVILDERPEATSYDFQSGVRVYANNEAKEFDCGIEEVFEWYQPTAEYDPLMNVEPTYEAAAQQVDVGASNEIAQDSKTVFAARIAEQEAALKEKCKTVVVDPKDPTYDETAYKECEAIFVEECKTVVTDDKDPTYDAAAATKCATVSANVAAAGGKLEVSSFRQDVAKDMTQAFAQGYTLYEKINESDWWWWWMSFDVPDSLIKDGDIIYQYVTMSRDAKNIKGETVKDSETVGCYVTKGEKDLPSTVDVFTHEDNKVWQLNMKDAAGADNTLVKGKTYDKQAAVLKQAESDEKWKAGKSHIPASALPAASTKAGNVKYVCYFQLEIPKLARKPGDFGINLDIQVSTRVYEGKTNTTPIQVAVHSETIEKKALPEYKTETKTSTSTSSSSSGGDAPAATGAVANVVASFAALIAVFFAMF